MTFNNWQNVVQDQGKLQPWRVPDLCRRREGQGLMQGTVFLQMLKGQCHEILCHFFISWKEAIWAPDKQANMVLLKNSFSRRYSQKIRLRAVLACMESNSAQANSVRSQTLRRITLRSQTNFSDFQISSFPGNIGSIWRYFKKIWIFFENPNWITLRECALTLRRLTLCGVQLRPG